MWQDGPPEGTYRRKYRGEILLSVLQELAKDYDLEIDAIGNGPAQVLFRVHPTSGVDHRQGNAAGNPWVIFSQGFDNIAQASYTDDWMDEANAIWIAGVGEAETRLMHLAENTTRQTESPWNYREDWVDAPDLDNLSSLRDRGYGELVKRGPAQDLAFELLETDACKYGRDWNLSDLVTGRYRGISQDFRVRAVEVAVANTGVEQIYPVLEYYG
jgi:hypothetical protein